jgi:hypothetical protein
MTLSLLIIAAQRRCHRTGRPVRRTKWQKIEQEIDIAGQSCALYPPGESRTKGLLSSVSQVMNKEKRLNNHNDTSIMFTTTRGNKPLPLFY